jgi:hypothetical protein
MVQGVSVMQLSGMVMQSFVRESLKSGGCDANLNQLHNGCES